MNKLIIAALSILIITTSLNAQTGSPYSQMGIGDISHKAFGQSKAMGGIGLGIRTNRHLNISNPAAYTALDSNNVIYEIGIIGELNKIEANGTDELKKSGGIDYFALGFRATKHWYASAGLLNMSEVDYLISIDKTTPYNGIIRNYYYGEGGIYKAYLTNSFEIIKKQLSVGINLAYNFGSINNVKSTIFMQDPYAYNSKYQEKNSIYGLTIDGGLQYTYNIKKNTDITLGLTYSGNMKINKKSNIIGGSTSNSGESRKSIRGIVEGELRDTIYQAKDLENKLEVPQEIGVGIAWENKNKFIIGADVIYQNWSKIKSDIKLNDQISAHIGMEFIPDKNSITNYFKRTHYRIGAYMKQSYIMIDNNNINDYGITFGLGLPLRGSSFNLVFEFGQRGSNDKGLIKENYGILTLNLSLLDIWFLKRKYN